MVPIAVVKKAGVHAGAVDFDFDFDFDCLDEWQIAVMVKVVAEAGDYGLRWVVMAMVAMAVVEGSSFWTLIYY